MNSNKEEVVKTILSFRLGEEVFAIGVSRVINILELSQITKIPKSPDYMKGVINLRGAVLPVIDLRTKFGLPEKEATIDTCVIVLSINVTGEQVFIGTFVDAVCEVLDLRIEDIAPSPSIGTKHDSGFIEGMWRINEKFVMILDIDKVFSNDEVLDIKEQITQTIV